MPKSTVSSSSVTQLFSSIVRSTLRNNTEKWVYAFTHECHVLFQLEGNTTPLGRIQDLAGSDPWTKQLATAILELLDLELKEGRLSDANRYYFLLGSLAWEKSNSPIRWNTSLWLELYRKESDDTTNVVEVSLYE